jgi:hypothetical protein
MAAAAGNTVTTTGTGASDHLTLGQGEHVLTIAWAGSAGDADLQVSGDGTTFIDVLDAPNGSVVNYTANGAVRVAGGMRYRLDVNTHTSAATMTAHRAEI